MTRRIIPWIVILISVSLQSCGLLLRNQLNKKFPPVSGLERKLEALDKQVEALNHIQKPDFGVHLTPAELNEQLTSFVKNQINLKPEMEDVSIRQLTVNHLNVQFAPQEIGINANVSLDFDHPKIKSIRVAIKGFITPYVYNDTLTFIPVLKELRVEKVRLKGIFRSLAILRPVLNTLLTQYINNINGQFQYLKIPLPKDILQKKKLSEWLSATEGVEIVNDFTIELKRKIGPVVILIDDKGLDLLGEMVLPQQAPAIESPKELQEKLSTPHTFTATGKSIELKLQQLSVSDSAWMSFKQSLSIYKNDLLAAKLPSLSTQITPPLFILNSATTPVPDFNKLFADYKIRFNEFWNSSLDPSDEKNTSFHFSQFFISRTVNEILEKPDFKLRYQIPAFNKPIPRQHFEIVKKPTFDCLNVIRSCDLANCGDRMNRCKKCDWYDVICHAKWLACQSANGVIWVACQAENTARIGVCAVENAARFTWCTTVFLVELAAHHVLNIGDLEGNIQGGGTVTAGLTGLSLDEGLNNFALNTNVNLEGDLKIDLAFHPQGLLTWLTCAFGFNTTFNPHISASLGTQTLTGSIEKGNDADGNARTAFHTSEIPITVNITPSPIEQLLTNPDVLFRCNFVLFGVTIYSVLAPLLDFPDWQRNLNLIYQGSYDHKFAPLEFKMTFPEQNVTIGSSQKKIKSKWGAQSINFNIQP